MGRHIVITRTSSFDEEKPKIISIKAFANGATSFDNDSQNIVERYNYYPGYFEDLGYWNMKTDFHGKQVKELSENIPKIIQKIKNDGFNARIMTIEEDESTDIPDWWFGVRREENSIVCIQLSIEERIGALLFHLNNLVIDMQAYNAEWYCWEIN